MQRQLLIAAAIAVPLLAALLAAFGFRGRDVQVGIDLGTTFSTVGYRSNGVMHVMRNHRNSTVTASIIAATATGWVVGQDAVDLVSDEPLATVFDAKRLIGRRHDDPTVAAERARHGGRIVPHPTSIRDPWGRATTRRKCATCEHELAFVVKPHGAPTPEQLAALAGHKCLDPGSLMSHEQLAAWLDHHHQAFEDASASASADAGAPGEEDAHGHGIGGGSIDAAALLEALAGGDGPPAASASAPRSYLLVSPTAAGCLVVHYMVEALARELGHHTFKSAVVTIPAEFTSAARQATTDAYLRAGIAPQRVLHEPAAAAIAYGLHTDPSVQYVLVYDMGGGTLDVSVLYLQEGAFTVIGAAGDGHLGGEDFDDCLLHEMRRTLKTDHGVHVQADDDDDDDKDKDDSSSGSSSGGQQPGRRRRDLSAQSHGSCSYSWLKREAERVKIALNKHQHQHQPPGDGGVGDGVGEGEGQGEGEGEDVTAEWSCLPSEAQWREAAASSASASASAPPTAIRHVVSRRTFERVCEPLFDRALEPVLRGLEHANVAVADVNDVVLVGGSSRLLRVRHLLETLFKKRLRNTVDPDLAVAFGAALMVD